MLANEWQYKNLRFKFDSFFALFCTSSNGIFIDKFRLTVTHFMTSSKMLRANVKEGKTTFRGKRRASDNRKPRKENNKSKASKSVAHGYAHWYLIELNRLKRSHRTNTHKSTKYRFKKCEMPILFIELWVVVVVVSLLFAHSIVVVYTIMDVSSHGSIHNISSASSFHSYSIKVLALVDRKDTPSTTFLLFFIYNHEILFGRFLFMHSQHVKCDDFLFYIFLSSKSNISKAILLPSA